MNDYQKFPDLSLLIHLQKGSHSAYTEIYNRYFTLLYTFAYKRLKDEDLSKDTIQELFTELWNDRDKLKTDGNLKSLLYISIRSKVLNHFAHLKVKGKYQNFLENFVPSTVDHTDHLIREKELLLYIDKQIEKLPPKMKLVFEMSRNEHLSNKEIAIKTNTSEANISIHLANALKILRTKLGTFFIFLVF